MKRRVLAIYLATLLYFSFGFFIAFVFVTIYVVSVATQRGLTIESLVGCLFLIFWNVWAGIYFFKARYSLLGKVIIDETGVRVTALSSTVFNAVWNELTDIGVFIKVARGPIAFFFSKEKLNIDLLKNGSDLRKIFTSNKFAMIIDEADLLLIKDFMKYCP